MSNFTKSLQSLKENKMKRFLSILLVLLIAIPLVFAGTGCKAATATTTAAAEAAVEYNPKDHPIA